MVDEVMLAVAGAVAGKAAESLTEGARTAVRNLRRALRARSEEQPETQRALEAARDEDGEDERLVSEFAERLAAVAEHDPEIRRLTEDLRPHVTAGSGNVTNTVRGNVSGTLVQGRDFHGDMTIGGQ
ncbi:hypothetical protein FHX37_2765 [Haloactinospora alba]|uniref:Uncharacterized protein n=1 Tax=Haloactinospora alba TaxID=405555 RepID=A0A543NLU1_9ACTN|nr:hypothetical protein [Haloactinospora alba]TQN32782.1 hypothetical protein FHX37_2765 [Haloactinospora alba]